MSDNPRLDDLLPGITRQEEVDWGSVHKFEPRLVGDGYRFDPDRILEEAKGQGYTNILVIGETESGELWISSAANAGEAMVLMEKAKRKICFGDD